MFWISGTAGGIYLGRAVQGLGEAPVWALGPAVLSLAYPAAKGRAIGIYNAAIHIGLTMGPVIGLLLDPSGLGRTPFLLFSAFCVAGAIVVAVFLPRMSAGPVLAKTGRQALRGTVGLLVHRPSLVVLAGIVLYGGCYGAFLSVLPITAAALKGFGPRDISMFFVVFYAAISVSQLVAGPLSDRHGRTPFMIGGLVLAIVGLAAFLLSPAVMTYVSLAISSFGLGVFCVASLAKLNDIAPEHLKGTVSGGYYFAWALGYVLGPLMVGALDPVSPATGYWILCALMTGQVIALLTIRDIRA
jgi:MFS family permease